MDMCLSLDVCCAEAFDVTASAMLCYAVSERSCYFRTIVIITI